MAYIWHAAIAIISNRSIMLTINLNYTRLNHKQMCHIVSCVSHSVLFHENGKEDSQVYLLRDFFINLFKQVEDARVKKKM